MTTGSMVWLNKLRPDCLHASERTEIRWWLASITEAIVADASDGLETLKTELMRIAARHVETDVVTQAGDAGERGQ